MKEAASAAVAEGWFSFKTWTVWDVATVAYLYRSNELNKLFTCLFHRGSLNFSRACSNWIDMFRCIFRKYTFHLLPTQFRCELVHIWLFIKLFKHSFLRSPLFITLLRFKLWSGVFWFVCVDLWELLIWQWWNAEEENTEPKDNGVIHGKKIELFLLNCMFKDSCDRSQGLLCEI